ncbi:zinc transporter ZIP6-like [Hetaerina americana]|uniref:zinc transporter ZIP6-like n=1 Tax=Hetaerina americana TaxID=62018 RepID=UPI003A7F5904
MGGSKGPHCDKLVTTVCMLCILCAPHSHCSLHGPQLPKASFHHHGQSKMGRPPDVSQDQVHDMNELSGIPKNVSVSSSNQNEPVLKDTSSLTKQEIVKNISVSEKSPVSSLHSRHLVSNKYISTPHISYNRQLDTLHVPISSIHHGGRSRRSGDHVISPLVSPSGEWSPFLEEIFKEFGDGKVINIDGFKKMLSALGLRKTDGDGVINADRRRVGSDVDATLEDRLPSETTVPVSSCSQSELKEGKIPFRLPRNISVPQHFSNANISSSQWHCLTGPEILTVAEVGAAEGNSEVNHSEFVHRLCPALVYGALGAAESRIQEIDPFPSTHPKDHHSHDESKGHENEPAYIMPSNDPKVWLYASLSVIVISFCGLLGVAVIPVMQKVFYHQLLQFLVALAVGTLCGDALIHLLPHAMAPLGHHDNLDDNHSAHQSESSHVDHHDTNMWKGLGTMLGLVFFFTTEKCLTLVGDWRKRQQKRKKPVPSRVRVMREAGPSSAVESGMAGQVLGSGADVLLGPSSCGSSSPRLGVAASSNSVGEKLCKHKYSSYPYCYGEITTGEIVNETAPAPIAEEKSVMQEKKSRQRRRQNGCSESVAETGDDKLEKLMVRDGSEGFVKSPIEGIGRGYLETHPKDAEGREATKEEEDEEEGGDGGNSYTVILREHERPHHGHSHTHGHVHSAPESISSVAWMVIMGDGLHNMTDGMAIGAAFAAGIAGGFSTAVAVLCHELPHELGDFAVLLKAGMTAKQAVFYNVFSSLLCYIGMILGIFLGDTESASQWIFAAAAGMFLYIALVDMIPELTASHSKEGGSFFQSVLQLFGLLSGLGIMLLIALYEHDLKDIFRGEDVSPKIKDPE